MDQVAALRERVETLEEENRLLRNVAAPLRTEYVGLGFSRNERIIFAALMSGNIICTRDYLMDCLSFARSDAVEVEPKAIDVAVCRLRKRLAVFGFPGVVRTEWGTGYQIRAEDGERLRHFFAERS